MVDSVTINHRHSGEKTVASSAEANAFKLYRFHEIINLTTRHNFATIRKSNHRLIANLQDREKINFAHHVLKNRPFCGKSQRCSISNRRLSTHQNFSQQATTHALRPRINPFLSPRFTSLHQQTSRLLSNEVRTAIDKAVATAPIVLFMKGTPEMPQCGFSRASIQILGLQGVNPEKFTAFNVLEDPELRQGTILSSFAGCANDRTCDDGGLWAGEEQ
jgi:hypothetical protein